MKVETKLFLSAIFALFLALPGVLAIQSAIDIGNSVSALWAAMTFASGVLFGWLLCYIWLVQRKKEARKA